MRKIYFQNDAEFIYCCEALFQSEKAIHVAWEKDNRWGNVMVVEPDKVDRQTWIHSFVMVYMTFRLGKKIKEIAQSVYFYRNEVELNRIYETTTDILKDTYYKAAIFPEDETLYTILFTIFKHHLHQVKQVHYDALVLFCMSPLEEYMIKAVGFGIDEMKREEAYQLFIVKAREFVLNKADKTEELHLIEKEELFIFKANGIAYSKKELNNHMRRTPLYMLQLDENEHFLAPIIALAPKKIYLYSDQPMNGKSDSLCRIFQEKVQVCGVDQFPFSLTVN